jgi:uncharacterized protein YdhG (YjbR/CyaY superfamily)
MAKAPSIDEYLATFEHPLLDAITEVRSVFHAHSPTITEEVKWNAPTFSYRGEYLCTIHVKALDRVMLIFHNAVTPRVQSSLLEGEYADGRRMAYFSSLDDVRARRSELDDVIGQLIGLLERRD